MKQAIIITITSNESIIISVCGICMEKDIIVHLENVVVKLPQIIIIILYSTQQ